MAFTFVAKNASRDWDTPIPSLAVSLSGIAAGDLIVVGARWTSTTTTTSVSDGTSTFTQYAGADVSGIGTELYTRTYYLLSSVASGTVTYTLNFTSSRDHVELFAFAYRYSGSASVDGATSAGSTAGTTAVASGNITTTGDDVVAFGLHGYAGGGTVTSPLINGLAANQHQTTDAISGIPFGSSMWSRVFTSTFTGQASATLPAGDWWSCSIAAFKATGAAPSAFPAHHYNQLLTA